MSDAFNPCPFCGEEAEINVIEPHEHEIAKFMPDYAGSVFVECSGCTVALSAQTRDEAILAWNRRVDHKALMLKEISITEKALNDAVCDRDRSIMRAGALEQAINDHEPCWACKHDDDCENNNTQGCSVCGFEYAEARFTEGGGRDE